MSKQAKVKTRQAGNMRETSPIGDEVREKKSTLQAEGHDSQNPGKQRKWLDCKGLYVCNIYTRARYGILGADADTILGSKNILMSDILANFIYNIGWMRLPNTCDKDM